MKEPYQKFSIVFSCHNFSSRLWLLEIAAVGIVKVSHWYFILEFSWNISSRFVTTHNVDALHSIVRCFALTNAKTETVLPYHLGKVTCAAAKTAISEVVTRLTNLIVPEKYNLREVKNESSWTTRRWHTKILTPLIPISFNFVFYVSLTRLQNLSSSHMFGWS